MLTDAVKEAVRAIDALFLEIAETEQDHDIDGFVEELWTLFGAGELRLIVEPVDGLEERERVAKENRPIVEARRAVLAIAARLPTDH
jgi:hypothetical protein